MMVGHNAFTSSPILSLIYLALATMFACMALVSDNQLGHRANGTMAAFGRSERLALFLLPGRIIAFILAITMLGFAAGVLH